MEKTFTYLQLQTNMENTFESYAQPFFNDLHYRLLHYSAKTNDHAQMLKQQTVTTADSQKKTYIYLQNAQEQENSGHTSNQY